MAPSHRERLLPAKGLPQDRNSLRQAGKKLSRFRLPHSRYHMVDLMSLGPSYSGTRAKYEKVIVLAVPYVQILSVGNVRFARLLPCERSSDLSRRAKRRRDKPPHKETSTTRQHNAGGATSLDIFDVSQTCRLQPVPELIRPPGMAAGSDCKQVPDRFTVRSGRGRKHP